MDRRAFLNKAIEYMQAQEDRPIDGASMLAEFAAMQVEEAEQRGWEKAIEAAAKEIENVIDSDGLHWGAMFAEQIRSLKYPGAALEHGKTT